MYGAPLGPFLVLVLGGQGQSGHETQLQERGNFVQAATVSSFCVLEDFLTYLEKLQKQGETLPRKPEAARSFSKVSHAGAGTTHLGHPLVLSQAGS